MAYFYSAAQRGFFHTDVNPHIPEDAIEISDDQHRVLMSGQASGQVIEPDEAGKPCLVVFVPTAEDRKNGLLVAARAALNASDVFVLRAFEAGAGVPEPWVTYRERLRECIRGTRTELPVAPAESD